MAKVSNPVLTGKVSNPALPILLAATFLLLGIGLGLKSARANETDSAQPNQTDSAHAKQTNGAHADSCLATPGATAPKGQHWYYRTDRQKGRKCWYLHAAAPLAHHVAARPHSKAATSAVSNAATDTKPAAPEAAAPPPPTTDTQPAAREATDPTPPLMNTQPAPEAASAAATVPGDAYATAAAPAADAPPPAADAPLPAGPADGVQPRPHIEILKTVPLGVPMQPDAQPSATAAPAAPAAQDGSATAVSNGASTGSTDAVLSITGSDVKNAASAVHKAEPDAERSGSDAAQQPSAEAPGLADTVATLQPTEIFFLLAIGLSMVVFLIAIASRIAAKRREPIITDYPDSAWSDDQFDPSQADDSQFADEAMEEQWTEEEQDVPLVDPQGLDELDERDWIAQSPRARTNRNKSSAASSAVPSELDPKGLEPVLRILREA